MISDLTTASWVSCVQYILMFQVLAMTATANVQDRKYIIESLGLKKCKTVIGNPDRKNIFYKKLFRKGQDLEAIEGILKPVALKLTERHYPVSTYSDICPFKMLWICIQAF